MKAFIRDNPTLAFGLGLPLLIVLVFLGAAALPGIGTPPPRYAMVFAANYYPGNKGIIINVENKKARVVYVGEGGYYTTPKLYIYEPDRNAVREIPINLPLSLSIKSRPCCAGSDSGKITPVPVPELEKLTLDTSGTSPDGYELTNGEGYYHDAFLGGLFFSGSYRYNTILMKGSYKFRLPQTDALYYGNAHFIGWVIPQ